ncbi:MAG: AMP-binding protein [Aeromicrobium sp.]
MNGELSQNDSVIGVLADHAETRGNTVFLVDGDRSKTYAEVWADARRHAGAYGELGVAAGDTVAFYMENSLEQATTSFGINHLGAIWSPVNTDYRGEWLASNLNDVGADVLVVDSHLLPRVLELPDVRLKHIVVNGETDLNPPPGVTFHDYEFMRLATPAAHVPPQHFGQTTAVLWTSGTTGKSKGVMQSNRTWLLWSRRHNDAYRGGVREGERFYGCTPMYNSGGWIMNIYPALVSGNAACIDRKFSVSEFWDRLRFYDANHVMTLGTMHLYLWNAAERPDDADNPLRTMMMTPVLPQILEAFMTRFGIERVFSGFGQSEIMGATTYHTELPTLKPGSCGYVRSDDPVETVLLDADDRQVAIGEVGEIAVRPREPFAIFSGYFNQPEETLEASRNLWHHTGDLGRIDEDGELFFVDRKKDSVRHKGRNTSTFEVEHIARQFAGVANVAAIGVKLEELEFEEELKLCVQPVPGQAVDPLELCKFIDQNAPYFFVPRYVEFLDELPMTPTNKVQKFLLREKGNGPDVWDRDVQASGWKPTRHR